MRGISIFYTLFWVIYFPVCIAFSVPVNFDWSDEILTVMLLVYAFFMQRHLIKDRKRWNEIIVYILLMVFYLFYSLAIHVTTANGVMLDILQQVRPYVVFYLTWVLAPKFNKRQKRLIKAVMILSFLTYLVAFFVNPSLVIDYVSDSVRRMESNPLGQLALCCGMIYYMFSKPTKFNRNVAILIMLLGLASGKSKYFGECICFISLVLFVSKQIRFTSISTWLKIVALGSVVLFFTWTKFNAYYIEGFQDDAEEKARPISYRVGAQIMFHDYVPFGSGLGSFATAAAAKEYSPLYYKYNLSDVWGLSPDNPMFLADAFYPTLAEYGIVGLFFFLWFWKRRLWETHKIKNIVNYRMALMCILALALESTADTSYLSGRGMGYFMILAVCLNSDINDKRERVHKTIVKRLSTD